MYIIDAIQNIHPLHLLLLTCGVITVNVAISILVIKVKEILNSLK